MKILSCKNTLSFGQIVCNDAIFDADLISNISVDSEEQIISFDYDANEYGSPLNLPFDVEVARFHIKVTSNDLHIYLVITPPDLSDDRCCEPYKEFINGFGDVEFIVRMTQAEKLSLVIPLLQQVLRKS